MTDISPAAKAVYDAFWMYESRYPDDLSTCDLANALRAAMDQVIPEVTLLGSDYQEIALQEARKEILAIADELEDFA